MWGALPFYYSFNPSNHRWSLGSYDICFTNKCDYALPAFTGADANTLCIDFFRHFSLLAKFSLRIGWHTLLMEGYFNQLLLKLSDYCPVLHSNWVEILVLWSLRPPTGLTVRCPLLISQIHFQAHISHTLPMALIPSQRRPLTHLGGMLGSIFFPKVAFTNIQERQCAISSGV